MKNKKDNVFGRYSREIYKMNKQAMSVETIRDNLSVLQIWDFEYHLKPYFDQIELNDEFQNLII